MAGKHANKHDSDHAQAQHGEEKMHGDPLDEAVSSAGEHETGERAPSAALSAILQSRKRKTAATRAQPQLISAATSTATPSPPAISAASSRRRNSHVNRRREVGRVGKQHRRQ